MADLPTLRARVEAAKNTDPDRRWLVYIPDDGWSEHRNYNDAESEFDATAEALTDESADDGWAEDAESLCLMEARYLRNFRLVHTAAAGDGSADGELCEARGHDYMARGVVDEYAHPDLVTLATDLLALAESQATQIGQALEELRKIGPADTLQAAARMATSKVDTRADALACALLDLAGAFRERDEARADLTAIRAALGNGADEAAWRPGETLAEAVGRLRGEHHSLRDVLQWVNDQCPGKCSAVCDSALRAGHEGPHAEALAAGNDGEDDGA